MKIYIIDDDPFSIYITESMLLMKDKGLKVRSFLSAGDALLVLRTGAIPDIIFLDLNMPVMDGWGFLEAVSPELIGKCSIYILTSSLDTSDQIRSGDYPIVAGFIHKPITEVDIEMAIEHRDGPQVQRR